MPGGESDDRRHQAVFPDDHSPAALVAALASIPERLEQGFTTFCIKPNQFIDDPDGAERSAVT